MKKAYRWSHVKEDIKDESGFRTLQDIPFSETEVSIVDGEPCLDTGFEYFIPEDSAYRDPWCYGDQSFCIDAHGRFGFYRHGRGKYLRDTRGGEIKQNRLLTGHASGVLSYEDPWKMVHMWEDRDGNIRTSAREFTISDEIRNKFWPKINI